MKKLFLLLALLLIATPAQAVVRYLSTTGATTNCTTMQTIGTPASSFAAALVCLSAGDTLYVRGGTYTERILVYNLAMNAGTSFTNAITISAYPGETVLLRPSVDAGNTPILHYSDSVVKDWYHIWQNLIFDGTNSSNGGNINAVSHNTRFVRFQDNIVRNAGGGATDNMGFSWFGDFVELLRNDVHHNGTFNFGLFNGACGYGIYYGGANGTIEGNAVHNNGGYGIHGYSGAGGVNANTVKFNTVYDNGQCTSGPTQETSAILMSQGSGNIIHNNLVYMSGPSPAAGHKGISLSGGAGIIYNNTITHFNYVGLSIGAAGTIARNNIIYDTDILGAFGTQIEQYGDTTGNTVNTNVTTNPLFQNSTIQDFRLRAGSAALNTGATLGSPYNRDIVGTSRPQGAGYDIGAFETSEDPPCVTMPNALLAYYKFEGNGTDEINGLTATLLSGASYTTGKYGQGLLVASAGGATVADNDLLDICNGFTIEAWVNVPSTSQDSMFVVKNTNSRYFLGQLAGYCVVGVTPMGGYSTMDGLTKACSPSSLSTSAFHHLAVSYDAAAVANNLNLYVDGALISSANDTGIIGATTGTLKFCASDFNEFCPPGTILDEVKVWRGPRTLNEISSDMQNPTATRTVKVGLGYTLRVGIQ